MKIVFFASGEGSNFKAILDNIIKERLNCEVLYLITDRHCKAIDYAKEYNIPHKLINKDQVDFLLDFLKFLEPNYIFLAGYMSIIPKKIIDNFVLKIINIHPSLLPYFKGKDAIKRAYNEGLKISGVTIHYINYGIDSGPIISQKSVNVSSDFEVFKKSIHELEHKMYYQVLKNLILNPFNKLIVSKCLLGENCRYDGSNKLNKLVLNYVDNFKGKVIKICPESEAGFKTPRDAFDYIDKKFYNKNNEDINNIVYDKLNNYYNYNLKRKINKDDKVIAILKENSPSCGVKKDGFISENLEKLGNIFILSEKDLSC
jgi:phosphoribosylglycinamide formyltransferase 1